MTTQCRPAPDALHRVAARWRQAGKPPQRSSSWSLRSWRQWLPEQSSDLTSLPNPIDRAAVIEVCRNAAEDRAEAVRGFVAAMVWGYGFVGYGAFRTARVLRENERVGDRLMEVAARARDDGGPAAFESLARNRLHWLGVAFATKYLFFCAAAGSATPALVLDQLVRDWLAENAGWSLRLDWRVDEYRSYVDTVCAWAVEIGVEPADVEMLMFTLAASSRSSQWSQPELLDGAQPPEPAVEAVDPDVREVLDALDEAAEAFSELAGVTVAEDAEDFERGLRHLRRIAIARRRIG